MNSSTKVASERKQDKQRLTRSLNLAYIYLKNNEFSEAEKYAREYLSVESTDRGFKLLGDVLRAQNKREEALIAYEKSLQLNPKQDDVMSLVCDLITPEVTNCDRLEVWASRAAKAGYLDIADKFRRSLDAAKAASFPSNPKLHQVYKNISSSEKTTPKKKEVNGNDSIANLSRLSLDSVDCNSSGIGLRTCSPVVQNRQENIIRNLSSHQDNLIKQVESQQGKVLESNSAILKSIGENKLLIQSFKKALDVVVKELRDLKVTVKAVEAKQMEAAECQKKLLDAFQTFQSINEDYGEEDYENGEYEDYGENYEQENVPFSQPKPTQTPLNVKSMPNFTHLQFSASKESEASQNSASKPSIQQKDSTSVTLNTAAVISKNQTPTTFSFGVNKSVGNTSTSQPIVPTNIFGQDRQSFGSTLTDFKFGSSDFKFSFSQEPSASVASQKPPTSTDEAHEEEDEDENQEEEEADVHFQPVIALPPQVEIISGEEEEEELFKARSKVYRFVSKEWKERGTGEMKVLLNPRTKKSRLLMRREQVLKVIVNHFVSSDLEFQPFNSADKNPNCYRWSALNASDGDPEPEVLAVRFKTAEIADEFLAAIEKAKSHLALTSSGDSVKDPSSSEVEVVFVKEPASELVNKAESLQLPSNFYSYIDKEDCPGCRGCEQDSDEKSKSVSKINVKPAKPILGAAKLQASPLDSVSICTPTVSTTVQSTSVFGSPGFSFTPSNATKTATTTPGDSTTTKSVFGLISTPDAPKSSFVFGGFGNQSSKNVFGSTVSADPKQSSESNLFNTPNGPAIGLQATSDSVTPSKDGEEKNKLSSILSGNTSVDGGMKSDNTISFGFKVPENSGSFFAVATNSSSKQVSGSDFSWGNDNSKASWMTSTPAPIFGGQKASPSIPSKTNGNNENDDEDSDDGGEEDGEYDPQYAPIIAMPSLVEVTTGEEDEEVVYSQRAKLFRYDKATKQWKERGIGDLKILKHRHKKKFRIVLRREQVHKIACNHYLTKDMKLLPVNNSDLTVCWFAMDYAEEEGTEEQFAAKFKSTELTKEFKNKFEELQQQL